MSLYQKVLERLLITIAEGESEELVGASQVLEPMGLTVNEDRLRVWPPWPWPPWGDDDDDKKPPSKSEWAKEAAEGVVEFEYRIANASLDL